MSLFNRFLFNPLFDNSDGTGTAGTAEMGKEDMIEFMASDDEPEVLELGKDRTPPKIEGGKHELPTEERKGKEGKERDTGEEIEETSGKEEEVDELAELEAELEEPTPEQLELVTPVRRQEILKKYPAIFKDFPYLEKAYYREQQYTELLPTIDDAKVALQAKETLDGFEQDVMNGNTETILKAAKETNPAAFNKIADNYLGALRNVDSNAYFHVIGNTIKHTIVAMVQEAKQSQNEDLQKAALLLNQFVFGTSNFAPPTNLARAESPQDNSRERQVLEREQAFIKQQFDTSRVDLNTRVNNTLRNTIDAHIDPKNSMSDYVKKNASRDALEHLETLISKDARFRALADKLWEKAFQDGFTRDSVERIKSAYLSKARTLLPSVIKRARNDALRGIGKRVMEEESGQEEQTSQQSNRGPIRTERPRSTTSGKVKEAKDIPKGMKTLDFLMQD